MSNDDERYIYMGDGKTIKVEMNETFRLLLKISYHLNLQETYVVPFFRQILISISISDKYNYSCYVKNENFNLPGN